MRRHGYVTLSRKLFKDDPFWNEKRVFSRAEAWIDLIQRAAFKKHRKMVNGRIVHLERGELVASIRFLSDAWGWSRKRVTTFLALVLDRDGDRHRMETVRETPSGTVYRIVNYDTYQLGGDSKGASKRDGGGTARGQQGDKENKGERKRSKEVDQNLDAADAARDSGGVGDDEPEEENDGEEERVQVDLHGRLVEDDGGDDRGAEPDVLRGEDRAALERRATAWIVARWIDANRARGVAPSEADRSKQGKFAKRIARSRPFEQIPEAVEGIGRLWQFDHAQNGAASQWDCYDLERLFAKAVEAGVNPKLSRGSHKLARNLAAIDEGMAMIEGES